MSTTGDDGSSRLSNALDEIFARSTSPSDRVADPAPNDPMPVADWSVDDSDDKRPDDRDDERPDDRVDDRVGEHVDDRVGEHVDDGHDAGPDDVDQFPDDDHAAEHDDHDEQAYVLPEIVPATVDEEPAPPGVAPTAAAPPVMTPAVVAVAPGVTARAAPASTTTAPPATSWADHMAPIPAGAQGTALRAPGRRPRVRRVSRVLRHIDPWSTFKVALLFSAVAYVVLLTAGVLLWRVADSTGTLSNVERWFTQFGWETFELKGGEIFHDAWVIGLFGVVAATGGLVLMATLFNLVSDIIGGVRVTVLEEEVVERTISSTRRYVVRRAPGSDPVAAAQRWDVDGDEPPARSASPAASWSVDDEPAGTVG